MKRAIVPLSSPMTTFLYKRMFPIFWFVIVAVSFFGGLLRILVADPISNAPFLIVPALMAIIGYQFMKKLAFNLVDEVFDAGDALIVRNGGREERIALADITNVNYFPYGSPPQVTLSLRRSSAFGDTIVFCGPSSFMPL